jgi:gamma-polyglutamate biosynthesis protein CapA
MFRNTTHVVVGILVIVGVCISVLLGAPQKIHDSTIVQAVTTAIADAVSQKPSSTTILFVGDMMFDRYIRQTIRNKGDEYLFGCIKSVFDEVDVIVGNLEGPITANPSVSEGSVVGSPANFRFTFPTSTAEMLAKYNIKIVNLGNNHGNDFGADGVASTRQALTDAGVKYFGGFAGDSPVHRTTLHGVDLSFVNYNQFGGDTPDVVAGVIKTERNEDRFVIVYTHWGEEYSVPTTHDRQAARTFAEAGAGIIIGSHPHVVQTHEMIGDTPVYYSLGNFIFDQYWTKEVSHGLALLVTISDDGAVQIKEQATEMLIDGRVCPR